MWHRAGNLGGMWLLVCLVYLSCAAPSLQASCFGTLKKEEFPNCQMLDSKIALHWSVGRDSVTYGIETDQTAGWFALGVSEGGGMRGGDIWVFRKGSSGDWTVKDYFAEDQETPTEDASQDVKLQSAQQTGKGTVVVFNRKLETCDYDNDQVIYPQQMQPYIYAYADDWGYHGTQNRGTLFLVLNKTTSSIQLSNSAANDAKELPLLMPNITVPTNETSYLCTTFEAPSDKRYQIIGTNYSITPNKFVHHMLLSVCSRKPDQPLGSVFECVSGPPECSYLYLVWVPGQDPEVMPAETGFPFGKDSYKYFMLQVHYTNPDGVAGVKDSTGFVPSYTSTLRKHDLGVMWVGSETFTIPPGEQSFSIPSSVCPAECTNKFTTDLNMVQTVFHMHALGEKQSVQHLRNQSSGELEEIVPLNYRNHYDYDWQGSAFILPGGETLMRGDALITTCTYNSMGRKDNTTFGPGSYDEMCYNFIRYWPAQKIDRCINVPGSEMDGKALVQCANTQEMVEYLTANQVDFSSPDQVLDMVKKGFFVQYDVAPYKSFKQYNRTSAACAAGVSSGSTSPPPPSRQTPGKSSQAVVAPALAALVSATIATVMMLGF